jgi:hypothetical protein
MVAVAITFVTEAISKRVSTVGFGEPVSKVKEPKARSATRLPWCVTATEAAGNDLAEMAS